MFTDVFAQEQTLPADRAHLFALFVERLFAREKQRAHTTPWIEAGAQHQALAELAYEMQMLGEGTEVERSWAEAKMPAQVTMADQRTVETPPVQVLALAQAASLLGESDGGRVKFVHHLMQEYFAGEALLRRHEQGEVLDSLWAVESRSGRMAEAVRGEWDPLPGPPTTGWEETTILAAGLYGALYDSVRRVHPALAARCLLENEAGDDADGERRVAQSQDDLSARLGNLSLHVRSRIEAGLLLGRLGDPRFVAEEFDGVAAILSPMAEIGCGTATIGSGRWQMATERGRQNERPRHAVQLAAYGIGRYAVTNAEYACFLAAGGYEEERLWSKGGQHWLRGEPVPGEDDPSDYWLTWWRRFKDDPGEIDRLIRSGQMTERDADQQWRILIAWSEEKVVEQVRKWYPSGESVREPRYWRDEAFNNPSRPVVGICWYEATAYARWLASVSGMGYRLPSEVEWEWAARRSGRIYPWGWRWDASKLNCLDSRDRVMRTTPVGVYGNGRTPDGIHDLAGNVWEWTATRYAVYPTETSGGLEDADATGARVVRGGDWAANRTMVRCASRNGNDPWGRDDHWGMRLARSLSS